MPPKGAPDKAAPAAPAPPAGPFWFTVRYGADQTQLFNMDCWAAVLVDHMKQRCGYGHLPEGVDLLKEDNTCVNLSEVGVASATAVLTPKATYYLCRLVAADGAKPAPEKLWSPAPEGGEAPSAPATPGNTGR